jgi:hypothetical protein
MKGEPIMTLECAIEILKIRQIKHCNKEESEAWNTLKLAVSISNNPTEMICQAHMAGQKDAGCNAPSWSNAFAYYKQLLE